MTYILINPVTKQMYEEDFLTRFLARHGYEPVECQENWGTIVLEKYRLEVERIRAGRDGAGRRNPPPSTVCDVRCPKAAQRLRALDNRAGLVVPDIEPILLHCAREISSRPALMGKKKLITTPCEALAAAGNRLGLADTEFLSWNTFLERLGERPEGTILKSSPIPPGFFDSIGKSACVTGAKEIESYLQEQGWKGVKIVELLECSGGCHRGDGVIDLE